jgi:hypothetical protein
MRIVPIVFLGLFVSACTGTYTKDPSLFYKSEDCNNPAKTSHSEYVASCGGER